MRFNFHAMAFPVAKVHKGWYKGHKVHSVWKTLSENTVSTVCRVSCAYGCFLVSTWLHFQLKCYCMQNIGTTRDTAKPGLWTLDWTVDLTMDWTSDDHYH